MPLRPPPGRAGRLWLERRIEAARRGADVLDQKRRALIRLQRTHAAEVDAARSEWEQAARAAAEWLERGTALSGRARLRLALRHTPPTASALVTRRNALGVVYATACDVELPPRADVAALGGSAALASAARAHREALRAAARYAVARDAQTRIARELELTARRARAVERRFIPQHEAARSALALTLDEAEREDAARTRWVARRGGGREPG